MPDPGPVEGSVQPRSSLKTVLAPCGGATREAVIDVITGFVSRRRSSGPYQDQGDVFVASRPVPMTAVPC